MSDGLKAKRDRWRGRVRRVRSDKRAAGGSRQRGPGCDCESSRRYKVRTGQSSKWITGERTVDSAAKRRLQRGASVTGCRSQRARHSGKVGPATGGNACGLREGAGAGLPAPAHRECGLHGDAAANRGRPALAAESSGHCGAAQTRPTGPADRRPSRSVVRGSGGELALRGRALGRRCASMLTPRGGACLRQAAPPAGFGESRSERFTDMLSSNRSPGAGGRRWKRGGRRRGAAHDLACGRAGFR